MSTRQDLLRLLADGAFHSGTDLGERLGVSRAAVNKTVQSLAGMGIEIHRVTGRGYRLDEPFVPLAKNTIEELLRRQGVAVPVDVLDETDSTNDELLRLLAAGRPAGRACLAEVQMQGRGRRGRRWVATPCHNIMLSLSWRFDTGPAALAGLSLATGVAVIDALEAFGVTGVGLKWPNDILRDGRKLAGLLVDLRGEAGGPALAVLGLGLNVRLAARDAAHIDQPWASLRESQDGPVDRNRLAALLITHLAGMCQRFAASGFEAYRASWEQRHQFRGQPVTLQNDTERLTGIVEGIDQHGGLRLRDAQGQVRTFHAGDISLRTVS